MEQSDGRAATGPPRLIGVYHAMAMRCARAPDLLA